VFGCFTAAPARTELSPQQVGMLTALLLAENSDHEQENAESRNDYRELQIGIGLASEADSTFLACDFLNDKISVLDGRVPVVQRALAPVRDDLLAFVDSVVPHLVERPTSLVGEWWNPSCSLRLQEDGSGEREIWVGTNTIVWQLRYEEQHSPDSLHVATVRELDGNSYKWSILLLHGGRMKLSYSTYGNHLVQGTKSGWSVFCRIK
jgi:hypothetical protein